MTTNQRQRIEAALDYLRQMPAGCDETCEEIDENDRCPEDMAYHLASLAARELVKALEES